MGSAEPSGYEAIAQVDRIREEPEKIKKWREEQKIRLEKKGMSSSITQRRSRAEFHVKICTFCNKFFMKDRFKEKRKFLWWCFGVMSRLDKESEKRKAEWREIAKKELDDWYKHREEQLEKTFKLNR